MAKTQEGKKFIRISEYTKKDGTTVHGHVKSTPKTSKGEKKK